MDDMTPLDDIDKIGDDEDTDCGNIFVCCCIIYFYKMNMLVLWSSWIMKLLIFAILQLGYESNGYNEVLFKFKLIHLDVYR